MTERIFDCVYCGCALTDSDSVPDTGDDAAWEKLAKEHSADCEWILTRAHRIEPKTYAEND